jgi:hypothetical protein
MAVAGRLLPERESQAPSIRYNPAMTDPVLTGIEEMRRAVALFGNCNESFNQRFTAEELVTPYRAYKASEWDITPDKWTETQVWEALNQGFVPVWEDDETPAFPASRDTFG